jgi:hypothetical protein
LKFSQQYRRFVVGKFKVHNCQMGGLTKGVEARVTHVLIHRGAPLRQAQPARM